MKWRRRLADGLEAVAALPGRCYAWLYVRFRLNRAFHRLGFDGAAQASLVPGRLAASCGLMQQPYRLPLASIRWGGRPAGGERRIGRGHGSGLVFGGDWDIEDKRAIDDYLAGYIYSQTVLQFLGGGIDFKETPQYRQMIGLVRRGLVGEWQARGCRSEAEVDGYFHAMRETFHSIGRHGYRSQVELGEPDPFNEIKVFIDRNGEVHKQQGAGHHRLAMARLLRLPDVPVLVVGVHRAWAIRCVDALGEDIITSIDRGLRDLACAPAAGAAGVGQPREADQANRDSTGTMRRSI